MAFETEANSLSSFNVAALADGHIPIERYDFVMLGSGIGVKLSASTLAKNGYHVTVVEREHVGVPCLALPPACRRKASCSREECPLMHITSTNLSWESPMAWCTCPACAIANAGCSPAKSTATPPRFI